MANYEMILNPKASVLELLSDAATASSIFRAAFLYFGLTFFTGCILGYFRQAHLVRAYHMTEATATLIEMPIMVLASLFWARWIVVYYKLSKNGGLRVVVGLLALGFMLATELLGAVVMHEKGLSDWVWERDRIAGSAFAVSLVLFGMMPYILILGDKEVDRRLEEKH